MLEVKRMYQRIRDLREDRDLTQKNMDWEKEADMDAALDFADSF